jgi:hypothetical protein
MLLHLTFTLLGESGTRHGVLANMRGAGLWYLQRNFVKQPASKSLYVISNGSAAALPAIASAVAAVVERINISMRIIGVAMILYWHVWVAKVNQLYGPNSRLYGPRLSSKALEHHQFLACVGRVIWKPIICCEIKENMKVHISRLS